MGRDLGGKWSSALLAMRQRFHSLTFFRNPVDDTLRDPGSLGPAEVAAERQGQAPSSEEIRGVHNLNVDMRLSRVARIAAGCDPLANSHRVAGVHQQRSGA